MDEPLVGEDFVLLSPAHFFRAAWECPRFVGWKEMEQKKFTLPDTALFFQQEKFGAISFAWSEEGLYCLVDAKSETESFYPEIQRGAALELFIDTRDVKTAGYPTKFCHHFYFLAQSVDEKQWGEITRFRGDDAHPLAPSDAFQIHTYIKRNGWRMEIFLPKEILFGYDSRECNRLGFLYRLSRPEGGPQYFSTSDFEFQMEQKPALWSTLELIR